MSINTHVLTPLNVTFIHGRPLMPVAAAESFPVGVEDGVDGGLRTALTAG